LTATDRMDGTGTLGALFDEAADAPPDAAELAFYESHLPRDRAFPTLRAG